MTNTKTNKRRACALFLVALILVELLFGLFGIRANAAGSASSYDDTPIESDMAKMEEAEYPANALGEPSIVGFMEYCYSENSVYSQVYGLYIYVYNPTEKPLLQREGTNQVLMSSAFGSDGKRSATKNYSLTYLDHTDNHRFYKFKITDSSEQYSIAKQYASLWNDRRRYEITSLDLHFEGEANRKTTGISKIYEFSGYAAWCGDPSIALSTLECQYYGGQDVHLQVYDTNYRFAHKGNNLYDDLQSVYFALPNEYADQWGNLSRITAEWYQYKTSPMFVTTDSGAYSDLWNMRNKRINEKGQLVDSSGNVLSEDVQTYWRVLWDITTQYIHSEVGGGHTEYYIGSAYNGKCREDIDDDPLIDFDSSGDWQFGYFDDDQNKVFDDWSSLAVINWLFYISEDIDSIDDYEVSSDEVKEYIQKYARTFSSSELLMGKYPVQLFERYSGDGYQYKSFSVTDSENFVDKNVNQSLWEQFWGINSTSTISYNPIVTIIEGDLALSAAAFSAKYYVNKDDAEDVIKFAKNCYNNNETPILLRFAKTDYYASQARFDYAEENKFDMSGVDGYVAQEHVFLNFDILSLEYTSEDGYTKTVLGVVADSIDIINGLTAPEDIPIEEEDWWLKLVMLLGSILIVVLLSFLSGPISLIGKILWDGFKFILSILFWVLTLPFKLIGSLFFRRR